MFTSGTPLTGVDQFGSTIAAANLATAFGNTTITDTATLPSGGAITVTLSVGTGANAGKLIATADAAVTGLTDNDACSWTVGTSTVTLTLTTAATPVATLTVANP